MIDTAILPACAKDLGKYAAMPKWAGEREGTYMAINRTEVRRPLGQELRDEEDQRQRVRRRRRARHGDAAQGQRGHRPHEGCARGRGCARRLRWLPDPALRRWSR